MDFIKAQLLKHREVLSYLFFGLLTTLVNIACFALLSGTALGVYWANGLAFFLSVAFAYLTNTKFVFRSAFTRQNCLSFFTMRLSGLLLDMLGMVALLATGMDKLVAKVLVNLLVIVFNYLVSKLLVYRKKPD